MNQSIYAAIFEALCRMPAYKDETPTELAKTAKSLEETGCFVDNEGDIIKPDGDVFWPSDNERTGSIGVGDEPYFG